MIECDWQAWYGHLPGHSTPLLHVAASCAVDGTIADLRLEPDDEGVADEADLVALRLVAERRGTGDDPPAERQVSWTGEAGTGIRRVRIGGEEDALVEVSGES